MASEADLDAWEQRLQAWEAELEAREKRSREREAILQDDETASQNALPSLAEPETASDGEETTLQDALSSLEEAEAAGGGEALGEARTLLLEGTCARSAALALVGIAVVASTCDNDDIHLAIKAAERAVRDAFVVRCRSQAVPGDRASFLNVAWEAFGQPPDPDWQLRIPVLLGSYRKNSCSTGALTFLSKTQLATRRRGRPRPRKRQARDVDDVVPARLAARPGAVITIKTMIIAQ